MSNILKGKFFNATRDMFGDNSVRYMNIELALTSTNYDDSGYGFDWGNKDKGSKLLASAILTKIGTHTVARIYTDKYTDSVIQKLTQDNWSLEAIEVAKWINTNTDYKVAIDEIDEENGKELEESAKEERKIQREKEFQQKIQEKLKLKKAKEKLEEERKREESENSQNLINNYKIKLKKYQNELEKQQTIIKKQQNEIDEYNKEIEKYQDFIKLLDIPSLRKKFIALDEIEI